MAEIFTIGHSNINLLDFLNILNKHGIQLLVDVRSEPYSKYNPHFNKAELQQHVTTAGIEYRFSGHYIGGKPKDSSLYTPSGKPDYDKLAATEAFQGELKAIADIAETRRVVLMCSEGNPLDCHRERILAQVLRSWGITVTHILPGGDAKQIEQPGLF